MKTEAGNKKIKSKNYGLPAFLLLNFDFLFTAPPAEYI
jgi:hypothetical protein